MSFALGTTASLQGLVATLRGMLEMRRDGVRFRAREMMTYFGLLAAGLVVPGIVLLNPVFPVAAGIVFLVLAAVTAICFASS